MTEMSDYSTGAKLDPAKAYLVRGSDVNLCTRHEHAPVDADKHPAAMAFDRCLPGVLAFANRGEAQAFLSEHGGRLVEPGHTTN